MTGSRPTKAGEYQMTETERIAVETKVNALSAEMARRSDAAVTEAIGQFKQEMAETLLDHVSKAYGELKATEKAAEEQIAPAQTGLVQVCKQQGLTRGQLIERLEKDFEDEYFLHDAVRFSVQER
jgi:hypothetical protein